VTDPAADDFGRILTSRFGWRLDNERGHLSDLLGSRLLPGQSKDAYLAQLAAAPADAELRALAELLAVSETYFFRNPEQLSVLAEIAIPAVVQRRPAGPLRILSAGAATGEEAYSIAITVLRLRRRLALPPVEILGVDFSRPAVERARRGRYSAWALRGLPDAARAEYFTTDGRHFALRPEVAAMVRFEEHNLLDLRGAAEGPWDIVFFRNTFMYFTPEAAAQVIETLADRMTAGGFLFLGHAETLRGVTDAFAFGQARETVYYVRRPADADDLPQLPAVASASPDPVGQPLPPIDDTWFHEIARAGERVASLVDARGAENSAAGPSSPAPCPSAGNAEAFALFRAERFHDALAALGDCGDAETGLMRAVVLANLGRLAEARAAAEQVLAGEAQNACAHYVTALIAEREGDHDEALRCDRMAIDLDDTFAMPHLHAALIEAGAGQRAEALRLAQRAGELFAIEDEVRIALFGGGSSRHALRRLCSTQVEALVQTKGGAMAPPSS